jgi:hypothetical protein
MFLGNFSKHLPDFEIHVQEDGALSEVLEDTT